MPETSVTPPSGPKLRGMTEFTPPIHRFSTTYRSRSFRVPSLAGRPYALPVDILAEIHGPIFYGDWTGTRKLYVCSLELVEELCDEGRFAKNLTASLARCAPGR